ncbi:hypothetical protein BDF20DRAFT_900389 [Mycotypha africana]|uniref:uncharacterized protein n=1 Tax=Mycotypha africana TaxID=64632 RepID=UPI002301C23F|nr:uncharacterized protein BDF20DRAFT_900389 [Mycotypha africana]KAI8967633.1 hypothetical protein BDF20DRAFT_900389 [Mycotypha africana]
MEILFSCLIVIQAMLNGNKDWSTVDGDGLFEKEQELQCGMKGIHSEAAMEKAKVVPEVMKRLTDLLHLSKGSYTWQKWYQLRRMICTVLCGLCQVNLSPRILPLCQKHVFIRIMELMRECCKFDERSKSQKEIKEHRLLVRDGFDTIGKILKYARPAGLFEYDSHFTVMTCLDLVNYYLEFVVTSTTTTSTTMTAAGKHPAKRVLLAIEQILEDEKKKQQHQQQHQQQQQQPQPSLKKEIGKVQPGPSDVIYISSP